MITPKVFHDSIHGPVDMRVFLPLIHTRVFQRLLEKKQLGTNYKIFEDATHTRFSHSIGSCHQNRKLTEMLLRKGLILPEEKIASDAYALLHDIGHPAFSHVVEPLCPYNNDEQGRRILGQLQDEVEACGVDFELLREIFEHRNSLYLVTHDKNLGTEKMDYLMRDGVYSGEGLPSPHPDHLLEYIYFVNQRLEVDGKMVDHVKHLQSFYLHMYKNVYLRKKSLIAQRLMQKMVYELVRTGEVKAAALMDMVDFQLLTRLENSVSDEVRFLFGVFSANWLIFKEALVICYDEFADNYRVAGKAVCVKGVDRLLMQRFIESSYFLEKNPYLLKDVESVVAKIAGVPSAHILIVPVVSPERFMGKDVFVYDSRKTLKEMHPRHYEGMDEVGRNYAVLRICGLTDSAVNTDTRKKLADPSLANDIFQFLVSLAKIGENPA